MTINDETSKWLTAEFQSIQLQLGTINKQTEKTEKTAADIGKEMTALTIMWTQHVATCPTREEFETLSDRQSELLFILKYWKVFIIALVACFGGLLTYQTVEAKKQAVVTEAVNANTGIIDNIVNAEVESIIGK